MELERDPQAIVRSPGDAKSRWHDTDNRIEIPIEAQGVPEDVLGATENLLPEAVAEQNLVFATFDHLGAQAAAAKRFDAEYLEQIRIDA